MYSISEDALTFHLKGIIGALCVCVCVWIVQMEEGSVPSLRLYI